jgi:hypothetical protein
MSKEYRNTKQWDEWVAKGGLTEGKDVDITVPFPVNIGCGVTMQREGKTWTASREYGGRDKKYLKTVTLEVRTWRGVSAGAVHYYGVLKTNGMEFTNPTEHSTYGSCGFGVPDYLESFKIELTRKLTQAEIDADPRRWEYYHHGSNVTGFNTPEEVIEHGTKEMRRLFPKGWKFVVNKAWESKKTVIKK